MGTWWTFIEQKHTQRGIIVYFWNKLIDICAFTLQTSSRGFWCCLRSSCWECGKDMKRGRCSNVLNSAGSWETVGAEGRTWIVTLLISHSHALATVLRPDVCSQIPALIERSRKSVEAIDKEIYEGGWVTHDLVDESKNNGGMGRVYEAMAGMRQNGYDVWQDYCLIQNALQCASLATMARIVRQ